MSITNIYHIAVHIRKAIGATFRSINEIDMAQRTIRRTSPHAEIAQRGWRARRWEDREDVLAGWGLRWGYGRGLEEAGGLEVGPSTGERARVREREDEVNSESASSSE